MSTFWHGFLVAVCMVNAGAAVWAQASPPGAAMTNPFFALDTGTRDATHQTIESQVSLIKDLGFAGFGPTYVDAQGVRDTLASLDQHGLKMFALFITANLDGGKSSVTPRLKEAIEALKGRDTVLWLALQSEKYKPSSSEGDRDAVEALQELSRLAAEAGIRIALYPQTLHGGLAQIVRPGRGPSRPSGGPSLNQFINGIPVNGLSPCLLQPQPVVCPHGRRLSNDHA